MEISILKDYELVKSYDLSLTSLINKKFSVKHTKIMALGLSAFNLGELQKGNLVLAPFFKNSSNIKYIFEHSFFDLGFSIGTAFLVAITVMILIQVAPNIGEMLQGNGVGNWVLGIIGIIGMIVIFLI